MLRAGDAQDKRGKLRSSTEQSPSRPQKGASGGKTNHIEKLLAKRGDGYIPLLVLLVLDWHHVFTAL